MNQALSNYLIPFLIGIASSIVGAYMFARLIKRRFWFLRFFSFNEVTNYKNDLVEQVRNMPFIYKDIEFEVMDGFVEVEVGKIDLETLELKDSERITNIGSTLVSSHKILFLGGAGFGKTTLQRYAILSVIKKSLKEQFVNDYEKVIPIFVPLKLLHNTSRSPIVNHILKNTSFIKGLNHFEKLLDNEKLMFFLDGYDEIHFGDGQNNFIQKELELIMFPYGSNKRPGSSSLWEQTSEEHKHIDPELLNTYPLFNKCRVWLSSRKNFFRHNPIGILGRKMESTDKHPLNFSAVQLVGIGSNRYSLISNIFEKYKSNVSELKELLNEEYFFNSIEESPDEHIVTLSHNPLFLTVMCYNYVQKVINERNHVVKWSQDLEGLITECIDLLLVDLDVAKVRDLPKSHRDSLRKRRNDFELLKRSFLEYFAASTFDEGITVFPLSYLKEKIRHFISSEVQVPSQIKDRIIKGLVERKSANPNFALQLIYCGLFVTIQKTNRETYYDFPHRRFRETLTAQAYSDPVKYATLLEKITNDSYLELMEFFKTRDEYQKKSFHEDGLREVLRNTIKNSFNIDSVVATSNFVKYKIPGIQFQQIVVDFLEKQVLAKSEHFVVSHLIVRELKHNPEFIELLIENLNTSLTENDTKKAYLICDILYFYSQNDLLNTLIGYIEPYSKDISIVVIKFLFYLSHKERARTNLENLILQKVFRLDLWYIIAVDKSDDRIFKSLKNLSVINRTYQIDRIFH